MEHSTQSDSHGHSHEDPIPDQHPFHVHSHVASDHEQTPAALTRRVDYAFSSRGGSAWDAVSVGVWEEPIDEDRPPPRV